MKWNWASSRINVKAVQWGCNRFTSSVGGDWYCALNYTETILFPRFFLTVLPMIIFFIIKTIHGIVGVIHLVI